MRIRKATEKDLPELVALWWQMHTSHYPYDKDYYQLLPKRKACRVARGHLRERMSDKNTIFLVAEEDGVLKGSLLAQIDYRPPVFPPQKSVTVNHVVVDKNHRGRGIFSKLQKRLDRIAKQKGAKYIELIADVSNPAVKVYGSKGYSIDHYKMVKRLK